jgi:hypothetical protein
LKDSFKNGHIPKPGSRFIVSPIAPLIVFNPDEYLSYLFTFIKDLQDTLIELLPEPEFRMTICIPPTTNNALNEKLNIVRPCLDFIAPYISVGKDLFLDSIRIIGTHPGTPNVNKVEGAKFDVTFTVPHISSLGLEHSRVRVVDNKTDISSSSFGKAKNRYVSNLPDMSVLAKFLSRFGEIVRKHNFSFPDSDMIKFSFVRKSMLAMDDDLAQKACPLTIPDDSVACVAG